MRAHTIANANHETGAALTSRKTSKHGLKKGCRRDKRLRNRAAKREDHRLAFKESL